MKPIFSVAAVLAAVSMASPIQAANTGASNSADLESQAPAMESLEIQQRRDELERTAPIDADEKARLRRIEEQSRPGPNDMPKN